MMGILLLRLIETVKGNGNVRLRNWGMMTLNGN